MKGSECKFVKYMEGSDKRFVIPVYQRNYDWKTENCKQLYDDLVKIIKGHRKSHFFGSLVSVYNPDGHNEEFLIIDGQQRLTTVSAGGRVVLIAKHIYKAANYPKDNIALMSLYWVLCEFFEKYGEAEDPSERDLAVLRNALEHKFVKVHEYSWDRVLQLESDSFYHVSEAVLQRHNNGGHGKAHTQVLRSA